MSKNFDDLLSKLKVAEKKKLAVAVAQDEPKADEPKKSSRSKKKAKKTKVKESKPKTSSASIARSSGRRKK